MKRRFCTYFDAAYLPQGLALYDSLSRLAAPFDLWVLCLDDAAANALKGIGLDGVHLVTLQELESEYPSLVTVRADRTRVEYYFTCTPAWIDYVVRRQPAGEIVTYVDSDLYFFSDPAPLYEEMEGKSILIVPHRFGQDARDREKFGIFNVGFLAFRNDDPGTRCLAHWIDQCVDWCYDRVEPGRFADQKYLDAWPARFGEQLRSLSHVGGGLAPWNWRNHAIAASNDGVSVDGRPLIFYHFHALKPLSRHLYDAGSGAVGLPRLLRRQVYGVYLQAIEAAVRRYLPDGLPWGGGFGDPRRGRNRFIRGAEALLRRRLLLRL